MKFHDYVIKSILLNNEFGIAEVNNLESIDSRLFEREQYEEIEKLIKTKDVVALKLLPMSIKEGEEFLDIMGFKDQHQKEYIVTVYDSLALEQDPQVIEVFSL